MSHVVRQTPGQELFRPMTRFSAMAQIRELHSWNPSVVSKRRSVLLRAVAFVTRQLKIFVDKAKDIFTSGFRRICGSGNGLRLSCRSVCSRWLVYK